MAKQKKKCSEHIRHSVLSQCTLLDDCQDALGHLAGIR